MLTGVFHLGLRRGSAVSTAEIKTFLARPDAEDPGLAVVQRPDLEYEAAYFAQLQAPSSGPSTLL